MDTAPSVIPAYVSTLLRAGLNSVAGILIGKGIITAEQAPELIGAAVIVVTAIWGLIQHRQANNALKDAIAAPAGKAQ